MKKFVFAVVALLAIASVSEARVLRQRVVVREKVVVQKQVVQVQKVVAVQQVVAAVKVQRVVVAPLFVQPVVAAVGVAPVYGYSAALAAPYSAPVSEVREKLDPATGQVVERITIRR